MSGDYIDDGSSFGVPMLVDVNTDYALQLLEVEEEDQL